MTAKEKAQEIYNGHYNEVKDHFENPSFLAKSLALKTVSQILRSSPSRIDPKNGLMIDNSLFWVAVQNEIEEM